MTDDRNAEDIVSGLSRRELLAATSGLAALGVAPAAFGATGRGSDRLRLAIPARRYLQGHLDDTAEALLQAYAHREEIKGLRRIEKAGRPKYAPALFAQLGQ